MSTALSRLIRLTPSTRSDRDLLQAYLDGADPTAFDELFRRHAGLAHRAASEVCPFAADDVAQTALALLARNAVSVAGRESAAGWVFVTARRLAFKARTAAARRSAHEAHATSPQPPADPLDSLTLREVRAVVAEELARLPDELRLPLVLCFWDGSTQSEAAARLGCSLTTLKRRLDAGRDRLAAQLARRGFAGSAVLAALAAVQAGADAAIRVARSTVVGFAPWKLMSAVVVAASIVVAGIGIGVSAPVDDPPSESAKPVAAPPPEVAQPRPTVDLCGDPLPDGAIARFGTIRFRHGQVHSIAYSPDGKTIASGGVRRIMLWESATGKPIASLPTKAQVPAGRGKLPEPMQLYGHIFGLAYTPDGKWLISVGSPADARRGGLYSFWETASPSQEGWLTESRVPGGMNWMRCVAVSPNGKTAAIGDDSGRLRIVDTKTLADPVLAKFDGGVLGLSFAPDGTMIAVSTARRVILLDPASGIEQKQLELDSVRQVAFAPDGKSIWVGCDGGNPADKRSPPGSIKQWDLQSGNILQTFKTVPGQLSSLAISPDGKALASGGREGGPVLWDAVTGKAVDLGPPGSRKQAYINGLTFAPDGRTLAVADMNGQVRLWDITTHRELHLHNEHIGGILSVSVSSDGKHAATVGWDGTVRIWEVATGQALRFWNADATASVSYTPDGRSILTAGWDGAVRLWDATTGKEVRRFCDDRGNAKTAVSPDGRLVAATGKDLLSITLYEAATGRPIRELTGHTSSLSLLTFSSDGRQIISAADIFLVPGGQLLDDRSVRVWDVATGKQLQKIDVGRPRSGMAVSPDRRVLAVGVGLGVGYEDVKATEIRFWDMVTGRELVDRRMKDVGWPVFSPDGCYLATAKHDDIRVVEVASGRVVKSFKSGAGMVTGLRLTPDGQRLVSAHDDGIGLVWDLTPKPLENPQPGKLWDQLASDDAALARQAVWALEADPVHAVTILEQKLKLVSKPADTRTTAAFIDDLAAPDFQVREAASRELVRRVSVDAAEISEALAKATSPEARKRLEHILGAAPGPWPKLDAEGLRQVRAVAVLEAIGTPDARRLLKALAGGDPYALLTRQARVSSRRLVD